MNKIKIKDKEVIEFGFGGHLFFSMLLVALGAKKVTITNLEPIEIYNINNSTNKKFWLILKKKLKKNIGSFSNFIKKIRLVKKSISIENFRSKKKFDLVFSSGVMEHVNDPNLAIKNIKKILKKNGLVYSSNIGIHDHRANVKNSIYNPWSFLEISKNKWDKMKIIHINKID